MQIRRSPGTDGLLKTSLQMARRWSDRRFDGILQILQSLFSTG